MKLSDLKDKRILILGFGREGQDTFLFLRKLFPKKVLGVADKLSFGCLAKPSNQLVRGEYIKLHLGKNYLKSLGDYDVIIKSPGIPFKILPKSALKKIITQTDIFFDNYQGQIVGVTGTKGKSTTTSMIYQILKAGGIKTHLVGNIGKPVLSFLNLNEVKPHSDTDIYAYELSSHQLYNLKKSPHIAVFLNIFQEHLDYYKNFNEYANAKANITHYQTKDDYLIFNSKDKLVKNFANRTKAKKIPIKGEYYELDKNAARAVGKIFKVPSKIIEKTLKNFKYLPHRLELVGKFRGITFYNDALATIPEATMAALDFLGNKVETIMLGGFDRKINFENLAKNVLKSKIKTVILFPTTGGKIWKEIRRQAKSRGVPRNCFVNNMRDAVKLAYRYTQKEKICLLSCASSSFSIFKDYKEKGGLFKKFVKQYGKET